MALLRTWRRHRKRFGRCGHDGLRSGPGWHLAGSVRTGDGALSEHAVTPKRCSRLSTQKLLDQGAQQSPRPLGLGAAGQLLRELPKRFRGPMPGCDFGDHLSIVGGRPEYLRLERDQGGRLGIESLGEIRRLDLGPLRDADLVETIVRAMVVRPA